MKTQVVITYETESIKDSTSVLNQIGLLLIKNATDKVLEDFTIEHKQEEVIR